MNRGLSLSTPLFRKYIIQPSLVFSFVFSSLWGCSWDTGPPWALFSDLESHLPMKIHHCFSDLPSALLFLGTLSREWEGPWCHLETAAGGRVRSLGGLGVSNSAFQMDLVHGSEPRSNSTSGPALQGRAQPGLPCAGLQEDARCLPRPGEPLRPTAQAQATWSDSQAGWGRTHRDLGTLGPFGSAWIYYVLKRCFFFFYCPFKI